MAFQNGNSNLEKRAKEVHRHRKLSKIVPLIMAATAVLLVMVYVISIMYTRFGSFTVSVNKYHQVQYGLSLSENASFSKATSRLNCRASEMITNIDGATLEGIDFGAVDGVNSGENYLCYNFYCKNTGRDGVSFEYSMNIADMTLNIEKAVRIRLITNLNGGTATTVDYARAQGVDENNNQIPEPNTTPFFSKYIVMQETVNDFKVDDIMKFTVVIWLEGNDPDCVDEIIGGEFKVDMKFSVIGATETGGTD
ncbi:MAG: hypothetical protein MJ072_02150 [Clostridia bacterium]|nr:hypothetical protein [Clostridia bacterium]